MVNGWRRVRLPRGLSLLGFVYLVLWAGTVAMAAMAVLRHNLDTARNTFDESTVRIVDHIANRALIAETAIESFAAFVRSRDVLDHGLADNFVTNLLQRYPFLYMFEVAEHVAHAEREALERAMQQIHPDFRIRRFAYAETRQWAPAPKADSYFPIVFQAPAFDDARNVIGLDLNSSVFMIQAMEASRRRALAVATRPFLLAENVPGYIIHRAIDDGVTPGARSPLTSRRYALLVLQPGQLFAMAEELPEPLDLTVNYGGFFSEIEESSLLMRRPALPASTLERWLLPEFLTAASIDQRVPSQPFSIQTRWQVRWDTIGWTWLGLILAVGFAVPLLVRRYAFDYFEAHLEQLERRGDLYHIANFDELTDVPNRHRLNEQLEFSILRARRDRRRFNLLFIDIDGLKQVNDTHGHVAGDLYLVEFAQRLSEILRDDEMLGRYGGDEFLLISNAYLDGNGAQHLVSRIRQALETPMRLGKLELPLRASIGVAAYPEDGANPSALIQAADRAMYVHKQRRKS